MPFYAVVAGRNPGVYSNWNECKEQIERYPGSWYKKFNTEPEANKCMESKDFFSPLMVKSYHKKKRTKKQPTSLPAELVGTERKPNILSISYKIQELRRKVGKCIVNFTEKLQGISDRIDLVEEHINTVNNSIVSSPYAELPFSNEWQKVNQPIPNPQKLIEPAFTQQEFTPLVAPDIDNIPPLIEDSEGYIDVYIDGAVSDYGKERPKGGVGVWFNHNHPLNFAAPLEGPAKSMNAELQAATRAVQQAAAAGLTKLNIHTDSMFIIRCLTKWLNSWKGTDWHTIFGIPVKNREELEKLDDALQNMESIKLTHIRSHQGNVGNENADILAHSGVLMNNIKRYNHKFVPSQQRIKN